MSEKITMFPERLKDELSRIFNTHVKSGAVLKANVAEISTDQLLMLVDTINEHNIKVKIKRSGTGVTVIILK